MSEEKKNFLKMLPYSDSEVDRFLCYDNAEYFPNRDSIANKIQMESGNVVKYYGTAVQTKTIKIGGDQPAEQDDESDEDYQASLPLSTDTDENE
ncbi:MAG: hypothetical protein MJ124_07670 [Lachnospiraceae bacterium]|nr:hypothetical protein [Lachnospiraceae bacterium]